jgi:hypothetical protein
MARDFAGNDGHQRALIGRDFADQRKKVGSGITLDVELNAWLSAREFVRDLARILGCNVSPVGTRMDGDSWSAGRNANIDGLENARHGATTRVTKCGDFVDVD